MKNGEDFVEVALTEAGEKFAGGGAIEIGGGNYHFRFEPGKPLRVTRVLDWQRVLSKEMVEGEPMFELAPASKKPTQGPSPRQAGVQDDKRSEEK